MFRTAMVLLAAVTVAAGCAEPGLMPRAATQEAEEDAIYLAVLEAMYPDQQLVIEPWTVPARTALVDELTRPAYGRAALADAALAADYVARSSERRTLRAESFAGRRGATVATPAVLDSLRGLGSSYWVGFRARYPGASGLVSLSRVGFSPDGTRALVTVRRSCGALCGSGGPVILAKREGRWTVVSGMIFHA